MRAPLDIINSLDNISATGDSIADSVGDSVVDLSLIHI